MIRYDQNQVPKVKEEKIVDDKTDIDSSDKLKQVAYDKKSIDKLKTIFLDRLSKIEINNILFVKSFDDDTIVLDDALSMLTIQNELGLVNTKNKMDFIKEFFLFNLDSFSEEIFGKNIITIKEPIFSLTQVNKNNENVMQFAFI